jgi:hypothetical protein
MSKIKALVTITYAYVVDVPDVLVDSTIKGEEKEAAVGYVQHVAQQRHEANCRYSNDSWDTMQMEWDCGGDE